MSSPFDIFLQQQGFVMLDGALATELERRGADLNDPLWSARALLEAPQLIRQVCDDYLHAGADVISTATYQASYQGLAEKGLDAGPARDLMRFSVKLALQARDAFWSVEKNRQDRIRPLVAASIGPYGAFLADGSEYRGDDGLGHADLVKFHRPRMAALADSGADLFAFETIPSKREALALVDLLAEFPAMSAWLSFSCRDGRHISDGTPFAQCAALSDTYPQVLATGVNCTDPAYVPALLRAAADVSTPLMAYPNSGEQWDGVEKQWKGERGSAIDAEALFEAGARIIGGCCRSTPDDIGRSREILRRVVR
jgi:homocysteine S-methyltransferase